MSSQDERNSTIGDMIHRQYDLESEETYSEVREMRLIKADRCEKSPM